MTTIVFLEADGVEHRVSGKVGDNLMQVAIANRVPGILAECGGACACATCHVHVDPQWTARIPPSDAFEVGMLEGAIAPDSTSRLACQIVVDAGLDGLIVRLPEQQI